MGEGELGGPRGGHRPQARLQEEEVVPDVQDPSLGTVSAFTYCINMAFVGDSCVSNNFASREILKLGSWSGLCESNNIEAGL